MEEIKKGWVFYCNRNKCKWEIQREYDCEHNELGWIVCGKCKTKPSYIGYPEEVKEELKLLVEHLKKIENKTGKSRKKEIERYNYLIKRCSEFEKRYSEIAREST